MRTLVIALVISCWLWPAPARPEEAPSADKSILTVGLKGGVGLPQLSSSLETTFHAQLEMVYQLPVWSSRLGFIASLGYSQPGASGSGEHPGLPDGSFTWEMIQRQTTLNLGLLVKVMEQPSTWNLGIYAGCHLVFLSTLTSGEAGGEPFGEHDEQATIPGFLAGVQAEYRLGPGALFGELMLASAFEDLRTTGELAVTSLGVMAGYRFVFAF